ncbi:MAG: DUF2815 family protein [Negativicutes bacterium]|nr:DUF2815 family protein [Negativicutes bacterium]
MTDKPKKPTYIYDLTAPVIIAHPTLITPRPFQENGKPKGDPVYSGDLVFPADSQELIALKELAKKAVRESCPGQKLSNFIFPFKDGTLLADARKAKCEAADKKPDGEYQRGQVVLKTKSKFPPGLAGIENGKIVDYDTEEKKVKAADKFFFGAEVLATVAFVAYAPIGENKGYVSAYLNAVFTTGKGTKLAGQAPSTAARFKGYVGSVSQDDPTKGLDNDLDDEIPF